MINRINSLNLSHNKESLLQIDQSFDCKSFKLPGKYSQIKRTSSLNRRNFTKNDFQKTLEEMSQVPIYSDPTLKKSTLSTKNEYISYSYIPNYSYEVFNNIFRNFQSEYDLEGLKGNLDRLDYNNPECDNAIIFDSVGYLSSLQNIYKEEKEGIPKEEIIPKIEQLPNLCYKWRKIKGDGNCYYRAIIFCYLEMLILTEKVDDFKDFVVDISRIFEEKKMKEILNSYKINGKGVISCVLLIYFILASEDERSIEYAYSYLIKSFNNSPHFDYGLILYFRYIIYKFLSANENKCYNKDFAVLLGNLLPNEYETEEGKFKFQKFYDEFLLKLYKDAEKIIIYMTPFILKINLHILILDNVTKSLQKMEFFQPLEDTDNFSNIITILYRGSHFDISYNETFYSKFKDYLLLYNYEDFVKKQEIKKKELEKEIALQKAEEDRLKKIQMEKKAAEEIKQKQGNEVKKKNTNNEAKVKKETINESKNKKEFINEFNNKKEPINESKNKKEPMNELKIKKDNAVIEPKNKKENRIIETKNKKENNKSQKKQEEDEKISIIDPIESRKDKRKMPQSIKMVINDSNQAEDKKSYYSRLNNSIQVPKSEYGDGVEYNLNSSYESDIDDLDEFGKKSTTNSNRINDLHTSIIFNSNKFSNKPDSVVKRAEIKKKVLQENINNSINFKNSHLSSNEDVIDNNNSVLKKNDSTLKNENVNTINIKKSMTMAQKNLSTGKNVKSTPISLRLRKYLASRKEKIPKKGIAKENLEIKAKIEGKNNFKAEEIKEKVKESKKTKSLNQKELINTSDLISLSTQESERSNSKHFQILGTTRPKTQIGFSIKKCIKCQKELKYDNGFQLCNKCLLSIVEKILLDRYALFIKENRNNTNQNTARFKKIYFSSDILNYNDIKIVKKESSLEKITEIYNNHLESGEQTIEKTKLVQDIENKVCVNCFKYNKKDKNPLILPCPCTICSNKCFYEFVNFVTEVLGSATYVNNEYTCLCNKTYTPENLIAFKDLIEKSFPNDKKFEPIINQYLSNNYCSSCKKKKIISNKNKESIYGVDCFPDKDSEVGRRHYLCAHCFKLMKNYNYPLFEGKKGQLKYLCQLCNKEHLVQKMKNINNSNGEECLIF